MKVLVISAAFPPQRSGEATNAFHICEQLAARGLEVHVLTSRRDDSRSAPGITVHSVMPDWSWSSVPTLVRFLRGCAPDAVYLMYLGWTYDFQFMSTFLPTIVKRTLGDVPVVTRFENIGGAGPQTNSRLSRLIRKGVATLARRGPVDYHFGTLLRDSDAVVLLSARHQALLEGHHAGVGDKCVLIPPPSNMRMSEAGGACRARGRQALGVADEEPLIAYIGFIYPGKGIETLLHGFAHVTRERPNARLAVIGGSLEREFPDHPSYLEQLQELSRTLGVAERVLWTGAYSSDSDQASTYLRAADVCALPFDTGVKLNNSSFSSAAAHGLPIVTTYDEHLEPQFVHADNVWLCPPKSPDALAQAIATVIDDESMSRRLRQGSLRLAEEWYSWPAAVDKTLALLASPHSPHRPVAPATVEPSPR